MYRALITAVAAAALVFGGVAPATAHTSWSSVPGAPTAVRVTGDADSATLTWRGPKHGAKVTGWKVAVAAVANRHDRQADRLHPRARSDRFDELSPATTYRFSLRALGHRGTGRTITLRWTAPPAPEPETTQSLFGLDGNGDVVRFADSGSGAKTVVARDVEGFAANADGDVFTPTADGTSILLHPADGGGTSIIASGLHLTPDLRADVAGNLYWTDSVTGAVQQLPVGTSTQKTVLDLGGKAVGSDQRFWTVTPDGKVVVLGGTVSQPYVKGTGIAPRTFTGPSGMIVGYPAGVLADSQGNVYVDIRSTGAAGSWIWYQLKPGATELTKIEPRYAFDYAAANADGFSLLQSAQFCPAPSEYRPGGCTIDRGIPDKLVVGSGGTSTVPVTGLTAGSRGEHLGAASADGDVFVSIESGPSVGLWKVPAAGGAAQRLDVAQYSRLLVI
ncbi:fibronectin type III domain-containing protein [Curtobacterium flaccumfaciens pv. flaccumfaciens]|uniref:Fibronectin type III domain-containing protein n=1 Tax=Curtobacterium flaccumfaciens pv. flaccumfaciens TaxID=138532 RepID=A0A9Q2W1D3_9MICO|nr:fibronectin type III domain-containing protein [Curtobacterium flaccumfaciens]MBT1541076.1 fibronectin type III domain-containing protein [Curtobacterium flaccumfaciens pv. flaccumfaciens]